MSSGCKLVSVLLFCGCAAWAASPQSVSVRAAAPLDTILLMVGDPTVQDELQCQPDQRLALRKLLDDVTPGVWALRDYPLTESREKLKPLLDHLETGIEPILSSTQRQRLQELMLQQRGPAALLRPEIAGQLKLSARQSEQLRVVLEDTDQKLAKLAKQAGMSSEDHRTEEDKLRVRERSLVLAVITEEQKRKWLQLRGKPFDLTKVQPTPVPAPAFRDADTWINSKPLTLARLRGQVVLVHFYTFGCINCQHNFEWYKGWQRDYAGKGLTIVGVHTPETAGEHDVDRVRQKAADVGFTFPILIDNQQENWKAWGTTMWPTVYLIDRNGYVRGWWYGELKFNGQDREAVVRKYIIQLLAEEKAAPSGR